MKSASELLLTFLVNFLLNSAWQIALVATVAASCSWLLRANAARYRHRLWVAALVLCLILAGVTGSNLFPTDSVAKLRSEFRSQSPAPAVLTTAGSRRPVSLPENSPAIQPTGSLHSALPTTLPALKAASPATGNAAVVTGVLTLSGNAALWVAVAYLIFLLYRGIQLFRAWRRTGAIVRDAYPIEMPAHVKAILAKCQKPIGVERVRLMASASIAVPVTVGAGNPLIILPEGLLQSADADLLTSAIGHELAHVLRRDFLLNLIYELLYLPLSFHPAAALVRRRIKQTRELRCDELVTERLLNADVYARSLVELARSAAPCPRPLATITVGIFDADILEDRVMTMLRKPNISVRKKNLSLIAASLLFAVPCLAAVPFALRISVSNPAAAAHTTTSSANATTQEQQQPVTRAHTAASGLDHGPRTIAMTEAQTTLLSATGHSLLTGEIEPQEGGNPVRIGRIWRNDASGQNYVLIKLLKEQGSLVAVLRNTANENEEPVRVIVQMTASGPALSGYTAVQESPADAEARERKAEARAKEERRARAGYESLSGQKAEAREREEKIAQKVSELRERANKSDDPQARELYEALIRKAEVQAKEERTLAERRGYAVEGGMLYAFAGGPEAEARRKQEREEMVRHQSEMAKAAKLTMAQAIDIATREQAGTVVECVLRSEQDQVFYNVAILADEPSGSTTTRVLVSAIDGHVIKSFKNDSRKPENLL